MEKKYIKVEPIGESRTIFRDESEVVEDTYEIVCERLQGKKEYLEKYKGTDFEILLQNGIAYDEAKKLAMEKGGKI
jgi:hypothetical protein